MMQQFNLNVLWPILAPFVSSVCRLYTWLTWHNSSCSFQFSCTCFVFDCFCNSS
jgi:hypothetical protein